MLTLLLLLGLAFGDAFDCVNCCKESGLAGCPARLRVVGADSVVHREGGGWRVLGLWLLNCDTTATYDEGATVVLSVQPRAGEVIRLASPPATITCYRQHCALPKDSCIVSEEASGTFFLLRCDSGAALTDAELLVMGPTPVAAPTTSRPDFSLPDPPTRCATENGLVTAALNQSFDADAKAESGDFVSAANQYRAALTIDPCSGGAWAGLGQLAVDAGEHATAVTALETATRLLKDHSDAWANLGRAKEALGQPGEAVNAYRQAIAIHPEHPIAVQALERIESSP